MVAKSQATAGLGAQQLRPGPVAGDAAAVPAQQRVGGDQPAGPAGPREYGGDGVEQAAVGFGHGRSVDLAA